MRRLLLSLLLLAATVTLARGATAAGLTCEMFVTQEDAQAVLNANPGSRATLDPDGDGHACEALPSRRSGQRGREAAAKPGNLTATTTLDDLAADVAGFWQRAGDDPGTAPSVIYATPDPPCPEPAHGATASVGGWYCAAAVVIVVNRHAGDAPFDRTVEAAGWSLVIAHEWGHHVQAERGWSFNEEQADCASGAYLADAEARGWFSTQDAAALRPAAASSFPSVRAKYEGYIGGLAACGLSFDHA